MECLVCVVPLHAYFRPEHLRRVIEQMTILGPPVLRAKWHGGRWYAREGTHRLRAAQALGLVPVFLREGSLTSRAAKKAAFRRCGTCGKLGISTESLETEKE